MSKLVRYFVLIAIAGIVAVPMSASHAAAAPAAASPAPASPVPSASSRPAQADPVADRAKDLYAQLASGRLDRSKLSDDINQKLTPGVVQQLSVKLAQLGTPRWQYVKEIDSDHGKVSVYQLTYDAATLYFGVGVGKSGPVYAMRLSDSPL